MKIQSDYIFTYNHIDDPSAVLGFSRELSPSLTYDELTSKVAERFAEVDLAQHVIRELDLSKSGKKLEKLKEGSKKTCDFKLSGDPHLYFEAKFTKNIQIRNLESLTEDALIQIKNSIELVGEGCIWIFTYSQPEDGRLFQDEVMKIKNKFSTIGLNFKLNVQTYSRGLYGDATV